MSDGVAGATPLEEQVDDVRMVIDAVGAEQPVLVSFLEGCCLTALSAASHPDLARALACCRRSPAWWQDRGTSGHLVSKSALRSFRRSLSLGAPIRPQTRWLSWLPVGTSGCDA